MECLNELWRQNIKQSLNDGFTQRQTKQISDFQTNHKICIKNI